MAGRIKYLFTLALPLAAAGTGAAWMMGLGGFGGSGDSALAYETAEITRGEIRRLVTTSGPVRAVVTVSVGSQLSGRIDKLSADFNSEVKEGDLLARLDPAGLLQFDRGAWLEPAAMAIHLERGASDA